jgi:predicted AAA+ superfamily ATPase
VIQRSADPQLRRLLEYYPVVAITGPRQSGKTTLARSALPGKPYVSLEDPRPTAA